jgi:hypothetical protein
MVFLDSMICTELGKLGCLSFNSTLKKTLVSWWASLGFFGNVVKMSFFSLFSIYRTVWAAFQSTQTKII